MQSKRKRWSQACCSVVAGVMLFGSVPAAGWAAEATLAAPMLETKISRDQAVEIAKRVVTVPAGYKGPETSTSRSYGDRVEWRVSWQQEGEPGGRIRVTVDGETGMVVSLSITGTASDRPTFPPKVTREQAVEIAKGWIDKLYPDQSNQYVPADDEERPDPADSSYRISFVKLVDGVPLPSQRIRVTIDGNGQLRNFSHEPLLPRVSFDSKAGVKPADEMLAGIREQMEMKLVYTMEGSDNLPSTSKRAWTLAYVPAISYAAWDAKSGEPVDRFAQPLTVTPGSGKQLAEQPQGTKPPIRDRELTEKEALEQLNRFIPLPEGVVVEYIGRDEEGFAGDHPVWQFHMEYRMGDSAIGWGGGIVDALTGEVLEVDFVPLELERNREQPSAAYSVSREQAREKALAFVTQHLKPYLHELYEMPFQEPSASGDEPIHRFRFERKVNGLAVLEDGVSLSVSARTGEVVGFHRQWHELSDLPDPTGVIDPNQAEDIYFEGSKLKLEYRLTKDEWQLIEQNAPQAEAKLVYTLEQPWAGSIYIDARTGTPINRLTGEQAVRKEERQKEIPADIRGHYAEKELTYFVQTGVLKPKDGKVLPEQTVSRGEFLRMLTRLTGSYFDDAYLALRVEETRPYYQDVPANHPDYAVIQWAAQRGWIDRERKTFEPDRAITREEAVEILVSLLGYDKVADAHEIYRLPYRDAGQIRLKGHVALALAIGLISNENQTFQPAQPLNRADAAIILYRYLSKRGEYTAKPID